MKAFDTSPVVATPVSLVGQINLKGKLYFFRPVLLK